MKKTLFFAAIVLLAGLMTSCRRDYETVKGDSLHARIYTLDNGLKVYLTQNADKPEIQTYIAVRAGAQNDPLESTGLAHYMEHIMFKGTSLYGTTDYAAEKVYLDQIDSLYEVYGHTTDEAVRKAVYHAIDSISYLSSKIAIASEFDKLMESIGASGVNAYTSTDRTCYHEVIPATELERWAAIESGRFRDLVIRGFHTELETVYEEFNISTTNDFRKAYLALDQLLYPNIPYRQHSVLGTQDHLQNPSLLNMKKFWNTYYRPNNVAIILSGDLDFDKTMEIVKKYFGDWEPNNEIPAVPQYELQALTAPRDSVVIGPEAPQLWMAWAFPGAKDADADIVDIIGEVLQNGKCGLIDVDVVQNQRALDCFAFADEGSDYTTFYVYGTAQEGQSLDSVRAILLAEIEKLKAGDFSEDMLEGIIANKRRYDMIREQYNSVRCYNLLDAFILDIPWSQMVGKLDRQARITKDDIVRVANRHFTDGYAVVYKQQGKDNSLREISKPTISPIEMNRGVNSAFVDSILAVETPSLTPQYLDMEKDLTKGEIKGREWLYRQNQDNELFDLSIIINGGIVENPALDIATDFMPYLGTTSRSAEQLKAELYNLAGEMGVYASGDEVEVYISGLQENMPAILALVEDWLLNSVADADVYNQLVADAIRQHNDDKADQHSCFYKLLNYGMYGKEYMQHATLTPEAMQQIAPEQLTTLIREKVLSSAQVLYYGPAAESDVKEIVEASALMQGTPNLQKGEHRKIVRVAQPEVLVAPYDAPNFYFRAVADWGEIYDPKQEAMARLFNQYFDGTMGSIVFQEMREARSLAYSAYAGYATASYAGDDNVFYTGIISQSDKLQDCVEAFAEICDNMPVSESAFEQAKKAVLLEIEQTRYTRDMPLWKYRQFVRNGWDHDINEDVYREVQNMTMDDLVAFQKEHVANRTYRYIILGNLDKLDLNYLKTLGKFQQLTLDDVFVY